MKIIYVVIGVCFLSAVLLCTGLVTVTTMTKYPAHQAIEQYTKVSFSRAIGYQFGGTDAGWFVPIDTRGW